MKGFTLIELIVDLAVLFVLLGMVLFLLNPVKQLNKARDGQRHDDFAQIRNALDTYYNDYNCYPTAIPFGQEWKVGNTVYMKKVPQDPVCSNNTLCYTYVYDQNAACPQWNVLFGKLSIAPPVNEPACPLQSDCLPLNYSSAGYNFCNFGGNIDCSIVQNTTLPEPAAPSPTTPPLPTGMVTPTPSSSPTSGAQPTIGPDGVYYCACGTNRQTVCTVTYNPPINVQYYFNSSCNNMCNIPC